ncbi:MFS transporter [Candidatus Falkowbacteria bacterium]|nr:MFS transporter [Candidatus Falkowbacteria bacterium]
MLYKNTVRGILNFKISFVIKILILSDFLILSAINLVSPIFAIFITDKINGATIATAGIAVMIYLIVKSVFEVPIAILIDKTKSEKDDFYTAVFGILLMAVCYFFFTRIDSIWQLYVLQGFLGLSVAISFPGWSSIFTRHIDKQKEALEWSLYDVVTGVGMALTAGLGALMVEKYGFDIIFYLISVFAVLGTILLFSIRKRIYVK